MEGQGQDWNEDGGRGEAEIPPGRAGKVRDELQGAARLQGDFGNPWPSIRQRCGGAARGARRVQGDPAFPDSNPEVPEHPPALQGLSLTHRTLPRAQSWPKAAARSSSAPLPQGSTKPSSGQASEQAFPALTPTEGGLQSLDPIRSGALGQQELDSSLWVFLHPPCRAWTHSPGVLPARNQHFSCFFPSGTEGSLECAAQSLLLPPS